MGKKFCQFLPGYGVFRQGGQIVPFVFVVGVIVKFFPAIGIADVAPAIRADGVVVLTEGGEGRVLP